MRRTVTRFFPLGDFEPWITMHDCQKSATRPSHTLNPLLSRIAVFNAVDDLRCDSAPESPRQGFAPWHTQAEELQGAARHHAEWALGQLSEGATQ